MVRFLAASALAAAFLSLAAPHAPAQEGAELDDLYGRGVHAYFSRDSFRAVDLLNQAIEHGSQDPRAYYFRGLALRNLGREEDAKLDFATGAKLEATGEDLIGKVSRSLERVQGPLRLQIESTRKLARLKARNERLAREEQRYGRIEATDRETLRRPARAPEGVRPRAPLSAPPASEESDPFADEPAPEPGPTPRPAPAPAPATPPATTEDPFSESPEPPPEPRTPAPAPATPAPATPAPAPAPPAADDPFADDAPPAPEPNPAPAPAPKKTEEPEGEAPEPAPEKTEEPEGEAPEPAPAPEAPADEKDPFE